MADEMKKDSGITPLGVCNFRGSRKEFGIKVDDRRRHIYMIGKTGSGKSTTMENMIISDIRAGRGVGIVDPHGELAEHILDFIPEERLDDVVYFNPADLEFPIAFNPLEQVNSEFRHLIASGMMGVFKKIWPDVWSARMEDILNNTLLALLEYPGSTLLGISRMLSQPPYRKKIVENLQDPVVKAFWTEEFANYTQRLESEATASIQNKVGQFIANPLVRNILGQSHSTLNMRKVIDEGKILIVNLSKGRIGEDNSALLGAMIITRLQLAAMSRVDVPEEKRRDFFLYVDEFQNFATESFATILSEARKYRLSLVLAHQYIGQLVFSDGNTKVRDAVFGNVGTIVTYRIGATDAEFLESEFAPEFEANDLVNLPKHNIYIKLMINGVASHPFSAETFAPHKTPLVIYRDVLIRNSQKRYGTPKAVVEERISGEWQNGIQNIEEKVTRRQEKPLSEMLTPRPTAPPKHMSPSQQPSVSSRNIGQQSGPKPVRRAVDIGDLRRAINDSLGKKNSMEEGHIETKEIKQDIPVEMLKKDSHREEQNISDNHEEDRVVQTENSNIYHDVVKRESESNDLEDIDTLENNTAPSESIAKEGHATQNKNHQLASHNRAGFLEEPDWVPLPPKRVDLP